MRIKNNPKSPFRKEAIIRKDARLGGYAVVILNQDIDGFRGFVNPRYRLGVYETQEAAVKAVRRSCASFKGRGRIRTEGHEQP